MQPDFVAHLKLESAPNVDHVAACTGNLISPECHGLAGGYVGCAQ